VLDQKFQKSESDPHKDKWREKNSFEVNLKMPSICNILSPVSRRPRKVPIIGRPAPTVAS
jgi:hypothetical protein